MGKKNHKRKNNEKSAKETSCEKPENIYTYILRFNVKSSNNKPLIKNSI